MSFHLQGTGVLLQSVRPYLYFEWAGRWGDYWGSDGQLVMPAASCVAITGRLSAQDGSLCVVFRFRPTGASAGSEVVADIVVDAVQAVRARQFAEDLAREYGIEEVSWTEEDTAAPPGGEGDAQDWLSAPISTSTHTLFHQVMTRLSSTGL